MKSTSLFMELCANVVICTRRIALITATFTMLLFWGCSAVGPDYVRPHLLLRETWSTALEEGLNPGPSDPGELARWWTALNDPILTSLIQRSIEYNHDLRKAKARVREARARRRMSEAGLFPSVDASGSFSKRRSSEDTGSGAETDLYSTGFDASWELDVFGGTRRAVEAAEADLEASREDLRDVLVSLTSETALNYIELRSIQNRLVIAAANLDAQTGTYNIARWRAFAGLTTQLDVEQARANLEQTRSKIPSLQISLEQAGNRISVLLGQNPGALKNELSDQKALPLPPAEIAVGVPADMMRRRPDIRRAERRLAAQTAAVGAVTADLYPKFKLSGSIGLDALSYDNLFQYSSRAYGISPGVSWNIFDAGRIRRNIEVQNALQEQALILYEQSLLTALEDVENALSAYAGDQVRVRSLTEASGAAQRAVDIAQNQYSSGLIDFQAVLDAQRSLFSLQDQVASGEAAVTSNLISLYKALGGGWTSMPDEEGQ